MTTYRTASGRETVRYAVEFTVEELLALADFQRVTPPDASPLSSALDRCKRTVAVELPECAEEPRFWRKIRERQEIARALIEAEERGSDES